MRRTILALAGAAAVTVSTVAFVAPAQAAVPTMAAKQLDKCGFTRQPNLKYWQGGSASMAPTGKIPAGKNVVVQGKAATGLPDGTRVELLRFNPAGKGCHGSLDRIGGGIYTTVKGGQYYINFQLDRSGIFGYALQSVNGSNSYEIEFQINTP